MAQDQGSPQAEEGFGADSEESAPKSGTFQAPEVNVDEETLALLKTLEASENTNLSENVPLAGVLRRSPIKRARGEDEEPLDSAPIPDVIAYEPIVVASPWAAQETKPAIPMAPDEKAPALPKSQPEMEESDEDTLVDLEEVADLEEVKEPEPTPVEPKSPSKPPPPAPRKPPPTPIVKPKEEGPSLEQYADFFAGGRLDEGQDLDHKDFVDNNWYSEVFTEDYFRTLPKNFHRQTVREVDFAIEYLGLQPGARVLDLGCGFGRHTMIFAKRKYSMVGLDLSMVLLQKALNEAQRRSLSIKFVHGDMRNLSFQSVFDAIYNLQTSFGYFNDQTNFKVLQGIYRALKPGGRFLIETVNRDFILDEIPMRIWWEGSECLILEEVDIDHLLGVLRTKRSFVFEDVTRDPWEQNINIRLYTPSEMRGMLSRAGFKVIHLSGDYATPGAYFGARSPRMIMVAEKAIS